MVCPRCLSSVKNILDDLEIGYINVELGQVEIINDISPIQKTDLALKLKEEGFELLDNDESKMVNSIKSFIIEKTHYQSGNSNSNLSESLSKLLHKDYSIISKTFSRIEGITIEQFSMFQRIEKVKELLSYGQMTIAEIAFELEYSSTAHLSTQFKQITGMSPTQFKKLSKKQRISLDNI